MTKEEKRALLASWASDIHAVTDRPALRQLENGAVVGIDDIFDALKLLDADPTSGTKADAAIRYPAHSRRQRLYFRSFQPRRNRRDDDDDDPTPSPVRAPFPKGPIVDTAYAKAVA